MNLLKVKLKLKHNQIWTVIDVNTKNNFGGMALAFVSNSNRKKIPNLLRAYGVK